MDGTLKQILNGPYAVDILTMILDLSWTCFHFLFCHILVPCYISRRDKYSTLQCCVITPFRSVYEAALRSDISGFHFLSHSPFYFIPSPCQTSVFFMFDLVLLFSSLFISSSSRFPSSAIHSSPFRVIFIPIYVNYSIEPTHVTRCDMQDNHNFVGHYIDDPLTVLAPGSS